MGFARALRAFIQGVDYREQLILSALRGSATQRLAPDLWQQELASLRVVR
jgi:hypothetical protein